MSWMLDAGTGAAALGLLAGGYAYAANWPTSQIFGNTLITAPEPDGEAQAAAQTADGPPVHTPVHTIALTYDDGPSPRNTPALLDLLAEHNVRATFFLIGEHVRKHPSLARRLAEAGHVIGNHTAMHPNLARQVDARVREELIRCQSILSETLGVVPVLFRPPYGARRPATLRIARSLGLTPVLWNVTAHDWSDLGVEAILKRIDRGLERHRRARVASNILLHDASHLDGIEPASRADTLAVTRVLLERPGLRFATPLDWLTETATQP